MVYLEISSLFSAAALNLLMLCEIQMVNSPQANFMPL
jgi:hypothetical protein